MATQTAADLADVVLPDHDSSDVRLGDLWAEGPVALVWLRHYGWVHCKDHAVQLHRAREQFEQAGVRLVLIGQATPRQAAHFRKKLDIDLPVLADEKRSTYKAAGWRKANVAQLFGPKSVASGVKHTARSGVMQGKTIGDAAQLGGAMIVQSDGSVSWSKKQEHAGDTVEVDELLAASAA